jgi:hypothetical protein
MDTGLMDVRILDSWSDGLRRMREDSVSSLTFPNIEGFLRVPVFSYGNAKPIKDALALKW